MSRRRSFSISPVSVSLLSVLGFALGVGSWLDDREESALREAIAREDRRVEELESVLRDLEREESQAAHAILSDRTRDLAARVAELKSRLEDRIATRNDGPAHERIAAARKELEDAADWLASLEKRVQDAETARTLAANAGLDVDALVRRELRLSALSRLAFHQLNLTSDEELAPRIERLENSFRAQASISPLTGLPVDPGAAEATQTWLLRSLNAGGGDEDAAPGSPNRESSDAVSSDAVNQANGVRVVRWAVELGEPTRAPSEQTGALGEPAGALDLVPASPVELFDLESGEPSRERIP